MKKKEEKKTKKNLTCSKISNSQKVVHEKFWINFNTPRKNCDGFKKDENSDFRIEFGRYSTEIIIEWSEVYDTNLSDFIDNFIDGLKNCKKEILKCREDFDNYANNTK